MQVMDEQNTHWHPSHATYAKKPHTIGYGYSSNVIWKAFERDRPLEQTAASLIGQTAREILRAARTLQNG